MIRNLIRQIINFQEIHPIRFWVLLSIALLLIAAAISIILIITKKHLTRRKQQINIKNVFDDAEEINKLNSNNKTNIIRCGLIP